MVKRSMAATSGQQEVLFILAAAEVAAIDLFTMSSAQLFERSVDPNSMQPGLERAAAVEIRKMPIGTEQCLLYGVLGERCIARDAHANGEQRARVRFDKVPKCCAIAAPGRVDPMLFFLGRHRHIRCE